MTAFVRKLGWFWGGMIVLALIILGAGGFFGVQYLTAASMGQVGPADGEVVPSADVVISAEITGFSPGQDGLQMEIDGVPLPAEDLSINPPLVSTTRHLEDGRHTISIVYTSDNVFSKRLAQYWTITVDTTPPTIDIASPSPPEQVPSTPYLFRAQLDEPGEITLTIDGNPVELTAEKDAAQAMLSLEEGEHTVVIEARDPVGNTSSREWMTVADYQAPHLEMETTIENPLDHVKADVSFSVYDNYPRGLAVTALLDGRHVAVQDLENPQGSSDDSLRRYAVSTGELSEGIHTLEIQVRDWTGHTDVYTQEFLVDSTADFGHRSMSEGAFGADVKTLHQILADKGVFEGEPTMVYDATTTAAVAKYQAEHNLEATGRIDAATIRSMVGYIVIDRSDCTLTLYDEKGVVKTYGVAVGQSAYPTPLGSFYINVKIRNPAWSPPPSPWAEGLEPVPPGPGNPLGTRWMGLSEPYVGIHGTPEDWSIGGWYSHGCIRMHIWDAEDLFDRVYVGTPVDIVQ